MASSSGRPGPVHVRVFQERDSGQLLELWQDCFPGSVGHNDPAESLQRKLAQRDELLFVAEVDGGVVGSVMAGYDGHRGWIYSLAVRTTYRRKAIGTALLKHAEQELIRRGCPKVNLQVRQDNEEVVRFYQSLGYEVEQRISLGKRLP